MYIAFKYLGAIFYVILLFRIKTWEWSKESESMARDMISQMMGLRLVEVVTKKSGDFIRSFVLGSNWREGVFW